MQGRIVNLPIFSRIPFSRLELVLHIEQPNADGCGYNRGWQKHKEHSAKAQEPVDREQGSGGCKDLAWFHPADRELRADDWFDVGLRTIGMSANTGSSSVMLALSQMKPLFIISSE